MSSSEIYSEEKRKAGVESGDQGVSSPLLRFGDLDELVKELLR